MAKRYAEAEALRQRFDGCKTMAGLAKDAGDARFEDLKYVKPSSHPRADALHAAQRQGRRHAAARHGGRRHRDLGRLRPARLKADEKKREKAQEELRQKEFEILAKRHLRDLRQDAHIEYR